MRQTLNFQIHHLAAQNALVFRFFKNCRKRGWWFFKWHSKSLQTPDVNEAINDSTHEQNSEKRAIFPHIVELTKLFFKWGSQNWRTPHVHKHRSNFVRQTLKFQISAALYLGRRDLLHQLPISQKLKPIRWLFCKWHSENLETPNFTFETANRSLARKALFSSHILKLI